MSLLALHAYTCHTVIGASIHLYANAYVYAPLSLWRRANARNVSFFTLYGG